MTRRPLHVLVVDDSALMRRYIRQAIQDAGHRVTLARDGEEALAAIRREAPDVVTLDINMPKMDGLMCLAHVMTDHPLPVVMVSSLTERGALATFEALELGAVDYVSKPGGTVSHNILSVADVLVKKVESAAAARWRLRSRSRAPRASAPPPVQRPKARPSTPSRSIPSTKAAVDLVLVGVSTGGPSALETIFTGIDPSFPAPVLVAQHMPDTFTGIFAKRMSTKCAVDVVEVRDVTPLVAGTVYIARGGHDIVVDRRLGRLVARSVEVDPQYTWHPCVSRMVASALAIVPPERLVGVQLTGMGDDGAKEMAELRARGGRTIAESEASCVVWGMPRALVIRNGATVELSAPAIAKRLVAWATTEAIAPRFAPSRSRSA